MSITRNSGGLVKLSIYAFTDRNYTVNSDEGATAAFVAPINPDSFTKNYKIEHNVTRASGNSGQEVKFKATAPEELKIDFIFDGTGTMEGYTEMYSDMTVQDQIKKFVDTVYTFNGNTHRPNFLLLIWGTEIRFRCVLTNLDVNYTLFHSDGTPIRAKASATFLDYVAKEERLAQEQRRSPDLTHYRQVKQADRLDLLTHKIYNSPKYLMQVAKVNQLTTIREITPGKELYFPPLNKNEV
jgi:hypothetical protein